MIFEVVHYYDLLLIKGTTCGMKCPFPIVFSSLSRTFSTIWNVMYDMHSDRSF